MLDDSDFAFYFASHSEVTLSAGRAVADVWSSLRALQLIGDKRKTEPLEDNPAEPLWKKQAMGKPRWNAGSGAKAIEDKANLNQYWWTS